MTTHQTGPGTDKLTHLANEREARGQSEIIGIEKHNSTAVLQQLGFTFITPLSNLRCFCLGSTEEPSEQTWVGRPLWTMEPSFKRGGAILSSETEPQD